MFVTEWASGGFRWSRGKREGKLELELSGSLEQKEACPSKQLGIMETLAGQ